MNLHPQRAGPKPFASNRGFLGGFIGGLTLKVMLRKGTDTHRQPTQVKIAPSLRQKNVYSDIKRISDNSGCECLLDALGELKLQQISSAGKIRQKMYW